ncbi:MAG: hypothetical protein ACE5JV_02410 [Nitrososphaerales archaeon]
MRKEYVIVRIDAAPDGSPQVLVSLSDPKDVRERGQAGGGPFGGAPPVVGGMGSMEDMMKNINKIFASQMMGSFTTTIKLSIKEYEDSGLKVGDKIHLDIIKPDAISASNELLLSADQMQKYEAVVGILSDAGIGPSEWSQRRNEILAMINKGVPPKEIADTIIRNLREKK